MFTGASKPSKGACKERSRMDRPAAEEFRNSTFHLCPLPPTKNDTAWSLVASGPLHRLLPRAGVPSLSFSTPPSSSTTGCYLIYKSGMRRASRAVQWLRLSLAMQRAQVRSPGQGTKIPHARWFGHKFKKRRKRLRAFNEGGLGWIPGRGTKILHVLHWGQQKTNKQKMGIIAAPVSQGFQNA